MSNSIVGASILNIITESLYDKPIVVFREYVQNSADALSTVTENVEFLCSHIWHDNNRLCFLDNGTGISSTNFLTKMESIAFSAKEKTQNIGYKGIGRLSGISYCQNLRFINILDFTAKKFQEYVIDCEKYNSLQKSSNYNDMTFADLMKEIGTLNNAPDVESIISIIGKKDKCFEHRNSGFMVVLENVNIVLRNIVNNANFIEELSWLLPVPFKGDLLDESLESSSLFNQLSSEPAFDGGDSIPALAYHIYFNDKQLFRPISPSMLRTYVCKTNFDKYAICVLSFSNEGVELDKKNSFSGVRMYIDNMLLCDENELIPMLQQYAFTTHGLYELIQTVRGVGALIYIVDKVNISANARRTFFETTDTDSLNLLEIISQWVNNIYIARYALSHYKNALKKEETVENSISEFREKALKSLEVLASDEIQVSVKDQEKTSDFNDLSLTEQKRIVKAKITKNLNDSIKNFLSYSDCFNLETCVDDFKTWYIAND